MSSTTAKQATSQAPPAGVNFPVGSNGRVSTTDTGKAVVERGHRCRRERGNGI